MLGVYFLFSFATVCLGFARGVFTTPPPNGSETLESRLNLILRL